MRRKANQNQLKLTQMKEIAEKNIKNSYFKCILYVLKVK